MKTKLALCAALTALLPLAGHAQTPPPIAPPIALTLKFTPGEVHHYKMTIDTNMVTTMSRTTPNAPAAIPPMLQHMEMAYDTTVQSVNPTDGSATILEHITQMTGTMNGQPIPGMDAIANAYKDGFTITMSPSGKMLSMKMPPSAAGKLSAGIDFSKLGGIAPSTLPSGPVNIGDTWGGDADLSQMLGQIPGAPAMKMNILSKFTDVEDENLVSYAHIHQTYGGTIGSAAPSAIGAIQMHGQLNGVSEIKFDINAGNIAAMDGTITANITTQLPQMPTSSTTLPQTMLINMKTTTHLTRLDGYPVTP